MSLAMQHPAHNKMTTLLTRSLIGLFATGFSLSALAVEAPRNVRVPALAADDNSIILVWEKPEKYDDIVDYNVYINGKLAGTASANNDATSPAKPYINKFYADDKAKFHYRITIHNFTATKLSPDTQYTFAVRAIDKDGKESADSNTVVQKTTAIPKVFNVVDFGAKGDGTTINTEAIQKAIDACTPGCKVLVPAGVFKTGAIYLKSNMTLEVAEGATLRGSERAEDYPLTGYIQYPYSTTVRPASLINALPRDPKSHQTFENIRIVGKGTIDGNGWKNKGDTTDEMGNKLPFFTPSNNTKYMNDGILAKDQVEKAVERGINVKDAYGQMRSSLITVRNVKNMFYGGFTVVNPAYHGIMNLETENVVLTGVTNKTYDANNGDGVEFANSRGAIVFNNFFDTGDDCVNFAAGTGADAIHQKPQEDAWIFNNYFREGHGMIVAGSHTGAWIQNVLAEDNVSNKTEIGLRMKSTNFMGGGARNVIFRDTAMRNTAKQAFIFTLDYTDPNAKLDYTKSDKSAQFRDIVVRDVSVEGGAGNAIESKADNKSGTYHENIVFEHVRFSNTPGTKIDGMKKATFRDVKFIDAKGMGNPWAFSDSKEIVFEGVSPQPAD
ncbi:glycosyl hydrolase family 28 protein [Uliginosibacterium sp. sgz301328]|uniref:glycosyl hydrolase family 28 protein n=1 Tax=Uliginosibacterium sp. sgz301328 TaxID=3243764 RepID=UPI00359E1F5A